MIDYKDKETLTKLYVNDGLSSRQIAEKSTVTYKTILAWLERYGIEKRGVGGELPIATFYTGYETSSGSGYEFWRTKVNGEKTTVRVGRLLAVAEYGFDEVCRKNVYYKNNIPWDNRPENISLVSKEKQGKVQLEKENPMENPETRKKVSESRLTTEHPHIKEGKIGSYRGHDWNKQRTKALDRDKRECQECGIDEQEIKSSLHVHHIVPYRAFDSSKKANKLDNLTSLCPACHSTIESKN